MSLPRVIIADDFHLPPGKPDLLKPGPPTYVSGLISPYPILQSHATAYYFSNVILSYSFRLLAKCYLPYRLAQTLPFSQTFHTLSLPNRIFCVDCNLLSVPISFTPLLYCLSHCLMTVCLILPRGTES